MTTIQTTENAEPKFFILISGKRFSGKDTLVGFMEEELKKRGKGCQINSFSLELKKMYCDANDLDLDEFLSNRELKEKHRVKMTKFYLSWSVADDFFAGVILKKSLNQYSDYCLVSDLRRLSDLNYLKKYQRLWIKYPSHIIEFNNHRYLTIRLNSSKEARKTRGWIESSYDDSAVECELDDYDKFDYILENNGSLDDLKKKVVLLIDWLLQQPGHQATKS